jgi:Asp-tRNA(Asn)/Glu-tRNA(Gln) amidotransferase A subunit family amidase
MKTSFGNRALFEMSEIENTTAVAVQKLIDAGAVVVGKNKLSEFAYAGPNVVDHINYLLPLLGHCRTPWNYCDTAFLFRLGLGSLHRSV